MIFTLFFVFPSLGFAQDAKRNAVVNVPLEIADAILGPNDAAITIVEYSDFQCPFCEHVQKKALKKIKTVYGDHIRIVFRHFPLDFHKQSLPAAKAAIAAGKQGKFWEMHDLLFEHQKTFRGENNMDQRVLTYAKQLGLNEKKFLAAYFDPQTEAKIARDKTTGTSFGVRGTSFFY